MKIIVATKNQGKVREFRKILSGIDCEIVSMTDFGIDIDVVEDADTFEGNAIKKASEIMKLSGCVTMADDSGLMVDALGGAPGVYSARYSGENATDLKNNLKLLNEMKDVKDRKAKFVCSIAVAYPSGEVKTTSGEFHGEIGYEMKGENGFGYDSLFIVPEFNKTSAELTQEVKNSISHRFVALSKMIEVL